MVRANEPRRRGIVVKGTADFCHEARDVGIEHERRRPERLVQLLPRHGARPVDNEQRQQLKRFGRERHLLPVAQQLPRRWIEREQTESNRSHFGKGKGRKPFVPAVGRRQFYQRRVPRSYSCSGRDPAMKKKMLVGVSALITPGVPTLGSP